MESITFSAEREYSWFKAVSIFGAARKYSITKYTLLKIHFPEKIQFAERIILGLKLSIFGAATRKYTWPQKFTLQRVSLLVASQIYFVLVENTVFELQWQWLGWEISRGHIFSPSSNY